MALNRVSCPECGAGLKSPSGFNPGQTVCCPKCETYFAVDESADEPKKAQTAAAGTGKKPMKAAVADDDEFEQPKKKKKKAARDDDDPESAYKNSTARYAILGVLVCVMVGLGVMLYLKKRDEAKQNETAGNNTPAETPSNPRIVGGAQPIPIGPAQIGGMGGGTVVPKPKNNPGGGFAIPLLDGGATLSPADATAKVKQLQARIVGTWKANLGGGKTAEVVYRADGTFTDTLSVGGTPTTISGRWTADRLIAGNKGILITRTVGTTRTSVKAEFEDDELLHDTRERGTVGTFRK